MTLGEYLNSYLVENNISMREFAKRCGISHTYISYIINGKTGRGQTPTPTIEKYRKIALAMNMDVNSLLGAIDEKASWGGEPPVVTPEEQRMLLMHQTEDWEDLLLKMRSGLPINFTIEESELIRDYRDASEEIREEVAAMLHRSAERKRKGD
jgi:transcriptional regulator with XRE-family HTH domain